jgi:hypothetical protein
LLPGKSPGPNQAEKMSTELTVKIGPNETLRFPGICTNCAEPAQSSRELRRRDGRIQRQIDVPLCKQCAAQLNKTSAAEERLLRQGRLFAPLAALLILIAGLLLFVGFDFWLRLPLALILASAAGVIVWRLFQRALGKAALPQKKAVLESAELRAFTWRTATFVFNNDTFIDRFAELNEAIIQPT